jgi:hypothetical protein
MNWLSLSLFLLINSADSMSNPNSNSDSNLRGLPAPTEFSLGSNLHDSLYLCTAYCSSINASSFSMTQDEEGNIISCTCRQ